MMITPGSTQKKGVVNIDGDIDGDAEDFDDSADKMNLNSFS